MDLVSIYNLLICGTGLALCLVGFVQALLGRQLERRIRRYALAFFAVAVAYVFFATLGEVLDGVDLVSLYALRRRALFWESLMSSLLMLLLSDFLLASAGEDSKKSPVLWTSAFLWLSYLALLAYTQHSGVFYFFDEDNVYHRGPWYPILLLPPAMIMLVNLLAFWKRRARLSKAQRLAFAIFLLVPLLSMAVQSMFYGILTIVAGTVFSLFFMFSYLLIDQRELYYRQERETDQLRQDIMLSQIQPHFLYNSLGAIQSLCRTDPPLAEKALDTFAHYLRGNMDSLSRRGLIPFTQELEHTRQYLELEQLRFEDALQVRYDLSCTHFRIPTLTLQPLAENAVRHGVRKNPDGRGSVLMSTTEYPDRIEVTVTDNGPGFDPSAPLPEDGRSHIGLKNIRERLQRLGAGELVLDSAPGKGTKASIILPKEQS